MRYLIVVSPQFTTICKTSEDSSLHFPVRFFGENILVTFQNFRECGRLLKKVA